MTRDLVTVDRQTGELLEDRRFNSLGLSPERMALLKRTYAKGTTDDEFALYLVKRYGPTILEELNKIKWTVVKIDYKKIEEELKKVLYGI